ncbi:MAG: hypothetical protein ACJAZO_001629 [Myxococcota bacterium]|jgi:hypothetical protein
MWTLLLSLALAGNGELNVGTGYRQVQLVDRHQSPLRYVGHSAQLDIGYTSRASSHTAWLSLDAHGGSFAAAGVPERPVSGSLLVGAGLQGGWMRTLNPDATVKWSVGGAAHARLHFGDSMADHEWAVGLISLDLRGRVETHLGRKRLTLDLGLPVAGLLTRHNYSLDPIAPGKGVFIAFYQVGTRGMTAFSVQRPYGRAALAMPLGEGCVSFVAGLQAAYLTHREPAPIHKLDWAATTSFVVALGANQ